MDKAFKNSDGYVTRKNRVPDRRKTTKDWELLIESVDGIMTQESLSYINESFPAQVIEYVWGMTSYKSQHFHGGRPIS